MRKWWRETDVEPLPREDERPQRVEEINARAVVPIETVGGQPPPSREPCASGRVDERFLAEKHHVQYGLPWAMGKCIFDFVVSAGVLPRHRVLDFGCGALRLGHRLIDYLEAGNYFGVDAHLDSLEAATTYELPLHGLEAKRPRLLWDREFTLSHFGTTFDWIVDFSSARRVQPKRRRADAYRAFTEVLAPGGRLLTSPMPYVPVETLEEWGLTLVRADVKHPCPLLEGHAFKSTKAWWEFVRS